MSEQWRPVVGYEGYYEVSDLGRVRSLERVILRSTAPQTVHQRILKRRVAHDGYLTASLWRGGHGWTVDVHTLVAAAFLGPRPDGLQVCHWDGDASNAALSNLRYDTPSANIYDRVRHGTHHEARKTHCKHGHPFDETNTARPKRGGRECRTCSRGHKTAWREQQRRIRMGAVA